LCDNERKVLRFISRAILWEENNAGLQLGHRLAGTGEMSLYEMRNDHSSVRGTVKLCKGKHNTFTLTFNWKKEMNAIHTLKIRIITSQTESKRRA
jgi:hypothetical protein